MSHMLDNAISFNRPYETYETGDVNKVKEGYNMLFTHLPFVILRRN
jgi:hypothetical protein